MELFKEKLSVKLFSTRSIKLALTEIQKDANTTENNTKNLIRFISTKIRVLNIISET